MLWQTCGNHILDLVPAYFTVILLILPHHSLLLGLRSFDQLLPLHFPSTYFPHLQDGGQRDGRCG